MSWYAPASTRTSLPWHAADSVRRAREELTVARQLWQQARPTADEALTDDQREIQERVMWSDVVYHAAVNAAMRAEFLPELNQAELPAAG